MQRPVNVRELLEHSGWVQTLARSLVEEAGCAEDIVQQTWVAALENPPRTTAARPSRKQYRRQRFIILVQFLSWDQR